MDGKAHSRPHKYISVGLLWKIMDVGCLTIADIRRRSQLSISPHTHSHTHTHTHTHTHAHTHTHSLSHSLSLIIAYLLGTREGHQSSVGNPIPREIKNISRKTSKQKMNQTVPSKLGTLH